MKANYTVDFKGNVVGAVTVSREGLYLNFDCRIKMEKKGIYRLQIMTGDDRIDLGVFVPSNDFLELKKSIPAKKIAGTNLKFQIISNQDNESFIELNEGQPFSYLEELRLAKFMVRRGIAGIVLPHRH